MANPELLNLSGELRSMTVLFSDARNFTTRAEGMTATEPMEYDNALLSALSDVITDHGGTIDKYMGDAVMTFWNAPLEQDDHAARACRAALGMYAAMDRFNVENKGTYPKTQIGVGINTGGMYVGNLGSKARYDYSAIGDEVNICSRFEGQTKTYGMSILTGAETMGRRVYLCACGCRPRQRQGRGR